MYGTYPPNQNFLEKNSIQYSRLNYQLNYYHSDYDNKIEQTFQIRTYVPSQFVHNLFTICSQFIHDKFTISCYNI